MGKYVRKAAVIYGPHLLTKNMIKSLDEILEKISENIISTSSDACTYFKPVKITLNLDKTNNYESREYIASSFSEVINDPSIETEKVIGFKIIITDKFYSDDYLVKVIGYEKNFDGIIEISTKPDENAQVIFKKLHEWFDAHRPSWKIRPFKRIITFCIAFCTACYVMVINTAWFDHKLRSEVSNIIKNGINNTEELHNAVKMMLMSEFNMGYPTAMSLPFSISLLILMSFSVLAFFFYPQFSMEIGRTRKWLIIFKVYIPAIILSLIIPFIGFLFK